MLDLYGYGPAIFSGTILTLEVSLASFLVSVLLGMAGALCKLSPNRPAQILAQVYTTIIRGIPDLVLMLLVFFGGQVLVNKLGPCFGYEDYIDISPFTAGVFTIGFIFGAYMTETFRGAILAVNKGQIEAGSAYGMSRAMIFRRITLPQMVRHALPGFGNNWLVLIKATALVSIIGLDDMVRKAHIAAGATHKQFTFYAVVAVNYLIITTVSIYILKYLEKRYSVGVRRI
ncbi:MAG: ABC transporter [Deltaproteobacteria bacterium]|nr:MAG: ABC transporter [Deltaproteobacteria bacterium]